LILLGKRVLRPNAMPVPSAPQQLNFPRTQSAAGLELFTSRVKREPTPPNSWENSLTGFAGTFSAFPHVATALVVPSISMQRRTSGSRLSQPALKCGTWVALWWFWMDLVVPQVVWVSRPAPPLGTRAISAPIEHHLFGHSAWVQFYTENSVSTMQLIGKIL